MTDHLGIVSWAHAKSNGHLGLPHSLRYVGIGRFDSDGPEWPDGAYNVVCTFSEPPSEHGSPGEATVRFLVEDAPHERLAAGARFRLYEGPHEVAWVEILW